MASVFCCGFECQATSAHAQAGVMTSAWTFTAGATISTSNPIHGQAVMTATAAASGVGNIIGSATFSSNQTIGVFGAWIIFDTALPTVDCCVLGTNASGNPGAWFKNSDSKIYAGSSSGNYGATGVTVSTGVAYYLDVRVNISANPWLIDVQVNGTACGQRSNAVAAAAFSILRAGLVWTGTLTAAVRIDDVKASLTSGDYPFGPGYIDCFVPTADGTHSITGANQFERSATGTDITNATTTAFQLVDEIPLQGGAPVDFINLIAPASANDYAEVIYGPAPGVSTPTVGPRAVEVIVVYAALSTNTNNLRLAINDNGTLNDVRNATVGSTTCLAAAKHYTDPPSAASSWTVVSGDGNFNNLRMRCFSSDANPDPYFVSTMIEAEFASPVAFLSPKPLVVGQSVNRAASY